MMKSIVCNGVSTFYGKAQALHQVSFEAGKGRVLAVLGPNGSGKTTLFRLLLGFKQRAEGQLRVLGLEPGHLDLLARLGATLEAPSYYPHLTGTENIQVISLLKGKPLHDQGEVAGALEEVGLSAAAHQLASSYSLGMRQRLALAQAIIGAPDLLILDEPTNGLDPDGVRWMRGWIVDQARSRGKTVVLATHLLAEAAQVADDLLVLKQGAVAYHGPLQAFYQRKPDEVVIRTNDSRLAAEVLKAFQAPYEFVDDQTLRGTLPTEKCPSLVRALTASGLDVFEIGPRPVSLESVYMDLMESDRC